MENTIALRKHAVIFGVPLLMILTIIFIAQSPLLGSGADALSFGVTADLLLTVPLIYFLLIRKTSIPKTTVVPVFLLGILIGSLVLPIENQYFLSLAKKWLLPVVEITVLGIVIYKVRKAVSFYKANRDLSFDFFTTLKKACYEILPGRIVIPFATEIAVFYYGFLHWKKVDVRQNEFTYHKDSGTPALLGVVIFLIIAEASIIHILLSKWSSTIAWILTLLSIYSVIQLFGFLKSIIKRPITIEGNRVNLRYGILSEVSLEINHLDCVELSERPLQRNGDIKKLSPLGELESHNVIIKLNQEQTLIGLYGLKKKFRSIALHVDDKNEFKSQIEKLLLDSM